jgi:ABC-type sugar transport system permease subunit
MAVAHRSLRRPDLAATQQDDGDADPVPVAGLLFFGLYVIIPIFQSFNISLYRWDGLGEATYIGLANYEELLTDRNFEISLWNNAKWLALYLLAIPLGLASRCSSTRPLRASVSTNRCSFSLSC